MYDLSFWFYSILIFFASIFFLVTLSFSSIAEKKSEKVLNPYVSDLSDMFNNAQNNLNNYSKTIKFLFKDESNYYQNIELLRYCSNYVISAAEDYAIKSPEIAGVFLNFYSSDNEIFSDYHLFEDNKNLEILLNEYFNKNYDFENENILWIADNNLIKGYAINLKPIFSGNKPIGYLGITLNLNYIKNNFFSKEPLEGGNSLIISNRGIPLIYTDLHLDNIYSETADKILLSEKKYGNIKVKFNGDENLFYYNKINDNLIYLNLLKKISVLKSLILFIICLTLISIFILFIIHKKSKTYLNLIDYILNKLMKKNIYSLDDIKINKQKALLSIYIIFTFAYLIYIIYIISSSFNIYLLIYFAIVILLLIYMYNLYSKEKLNLKIVNIILNFIIIIPVISYFLLKIYNPYKTDYILIWIFMGILLSFFVSDNITNRKIFSLFVFSIFLVFISEAVFFQDNTYNDIFFKFISFSAIGLCLYCSILLYIYGSLEDYNNALNFIGKLKQEQYEIVESEKISTIGQLVSSIAHEINNPMGAIKASSDMFNVSLNGVLEDFLSIVDSFSKDEKVFFIELLKISSESVKKMYSTSEIRKGKNEIFDYFESNGVENAYDKANLLSRVEICDLKYIEPFLDKFKNDNSINILKLLGRIFFLITGTNTIVVASDKVSKIVYSLKAYSNIVTLQGKEEFDVIKSIDGIIKLYSIETYADITINKIYEKDIPLIYGNQESLAQVWTNIIQNAMYSMKDIGGVLTITIKKSENKLYIDFIDTGFGIKEEDMKFIFDPFFTTKPLGEGSGLGLDICNKVITKHNGTIFIESEEEKGTVVHVSLPVK